MPGETDTSFTVTSNVLRGTTYEFKLKAENIFGIGEDSEITAIKAAGIPYPIQNPVTTSINPDGSVKISWEAPDDNSEDLTHYEVEIQDTTGSLSFTDTVNCPHSEVTLTKECDIPMSVLTSAPYSLTFQ